MKIGFVNFIKKWINKCLNNAFNYSENEVLIVHLFHSIDDIELTDEVDIFRPPKYYFLN